MKKLITDKKWIIMSKCGKVIAKGTPRNRCLVLVNDKNNKRLLTYPSKKVAENAFKLSWFYNYSGIEDSKLKLIAVEVEIVVRLQ